MAGVALGRGWNMGRGLHLRILGNKGTAMAVRARALETGMAHHRRRPGHKAPGVAGVALGNRRNVIDRLAQGICEHMATAMAAGTLAGCPCMTHPRRPESREAVMTTVALRAGGNVVCRLAQRRCAVVAGRTIAVRAGIMRVNSRCPGSRGIMATIALARGTDMRHRLHLGILGKIGAAVAGRAQAGQPAVVHGRGAPVDETADMAGIALRDTGNMIGRARQCIGEKIRAVVAGRALACQAVMAHLGRLE